MRQPARLKALRLVGFKSFAEKTLVEFGPGISAVVGPNGSGKSNLADALRWTLGEQGRLLRTRRSEDVIFAGSSSRRAIGMADVTLVIDNDDRLLPIDYAEVEIGRRLYRSGENEYLLNRQRIRLRELSELLDEANLADNAFLFIGQGMVDQALALRPEERRPLFEEAAGVRRHERRRRQAESELAEAEANLERVRDVLAELRPQARRLAAQVEQLEARRSAGLQLAEALVAAARARWLESWQRAQAEQQALEEAHRMSDAEMTALRAAEETSERHSRALTERAATEHELRDQLESRRAATLELRLAQARVAGQAESLQRDRQRLEAEREALERRLADARRLLAQPSPPADDTLTRRLHAVDEELAELDTRLSGAADAGEAAAQQHARLENLRTDLVRMRSRRENTVRQKAQSDERAAVLARQLASLEDHQARLDERASEARAVEAGSAEGLNAAREQLERAAASLAEATRERGAREAELTALRAGLAALEATLAAGDNSNLARAVRSRGGALLAEGLEVDPALRRAVSAALGDALRALVVPERLAADLRDQRGVLLLGDGPSAPAPGSRRTTEESGSATVGRAVAAAVALGGDRLTSAVRRDPQGHVTRLLARCLWVPELDDAISLRSVLPAGWRVVTRAGEVLDDDALLRLAVPESELELRSSLQEKQAQIAGLEERLGVLAHGEAEARQAHQTAASEWQASRAAEQEARAELRAAEEAARAGRRQLETLAAQEAWARNQAERFADELAELSAEIEQLEADTGSPDTTAAQSPAASHATSQLQSRRATLVQRRNELSGQLAAAEAGRRAAEEERRRAELAVAMAEPRLGEIGLELQRAAEGEAALAAEKELLSAELAGAAEREQRVAAELETLRGEETRERSELLAAEREAAGARERLRRAEARSRTAEVAVMEARLHLEQLREQLLVELAAIGSDGLAALSLPGPESVPAGAAGPEDLGPMLESALQAALDRWAVVGAAEEPVPTPARLAALRRQFHALGAGNPFAAHEYAELRERLESLEAQREDLESAMASTRQLIANLSKLITEQFLATFAALEGAFGRRFEQLFGGGEAQLSLTLPEDLSATGVEITARPPGKKRQPLAMLSGGERALTAVALLLAMLEVRPVPFCVLDEVDAALDEANISRFSAALRGLADRIQFIVITHNRGTIESADALYGVTIGEDAVSRIVSLRLPPVLAERPPAVEVPIEAGPAVAEPSGA